MDNSILNNIDNSFKTYIHPINEKQVSRWETYKRDIHDWRSPSFKYTVAGLFAVGLGGPGLILGRGRIKKTIFNTFKNLMESERFGMPLAFFDKVKKASLGVLTFGYTLDKMKDSALMHLCERKLGGFGKWLVELSKKSIKYTREPVEKDWRKFTTAFKELKANEYLKGVEETHVENAFSTRKEFIDKVVDATAGNFHDNYFHQKRISYGLWKMLIEARKNPLRGEWEGIGDMEGLAGHLKKVDLHQIQGDTLGPAMKNLEKSLETMTDSSVKKELSSLVKRYNKCTESAVDGYGGRLLELKQGVGLSEILTPPVVGGFVVAATVNGKDKQEKKDTFIKSGVPLLGGLGVWLYTLTRGVNGPAGILVSILSGLGLNQAVNLFFKTEPQKKA